MKPTAAFDFPSKALKRSNSIGNDVLELVDGPSNDKKGAGFLGESSGFGGGIMGAGTPRGGGSQSGNPWDQWDNNDTFGMGLGMDIQSDADILAEFGDFGDFFEDDGLGFGEVSTLLKLTVDVMHRSEVLRVTWCQLLLMSLYLAEKIL